MTPGWLRQLGLRRRVVLAFGAGALLLSTVSATATWWLSAGYLEAQRTRIATTEAAAGAVALQQGLAEGVSVPRLLERVSSPSTEALLRRDGQWFSSTLALTPDDLPAPLRAAVEDRRAVRQRSTIDDDPRLFVSIPLSGRDAVYVAVLPLDELDATLRTLSQVLVGAAAVTSLAGAALGLWASRRALSPLVRVNDAAAAVAAGDLTTRLDTSDPDLQRLAATFNASVEDLRRRVERDARFAADVSHELRSPLTTLANAVSVLAARRHELSPTAAAMVDAMQAEVTRFGRIVRDLLEISLDEAGAGLALEPVRVAELVTAAVDGRVDVQLGPGAEDLVVSGDRRRLERLLCSLLDNADVHGGGAVAVVVRRHDGAAEVAVEDTGPGVPAELRAEVFERFHRGSRARSGADGAGLGLALVARHVRLHRGTVHVEDRPGGGARFVVRLPTVEDA